MSRWSGFIRVFLLTLIMLTPLTVQADNGNNNNAPVSEQAVKLDPKVELTKMQKVLDKIKQQVSAESSETKLRALNELTLQLSTDADTLAQALEPQKAQLQTQLGVLGPAPKPDSGVRETAEVTSKRKKLTSQMLQLDDQIKQAEAIKSGAINLSTQIVNLRRNAFKTQLALNAGSILGTKFWAPLFNAPQEDSSRISDFVNELKATAALCWEPDWRFGTILWMVAGLLIASFGRRYMEQFLAWVGIHKLPEGRLRRSFLAAAVALTTLATLVIASGCFEMAFTRREEVSDDVRNFAELLVRLSVLCGLIAGLGRAFLSTRRPSWRLPSISDPVALVLKPFPPLTAALVFVFQAIESFNISANVSITKTVFAYGLTALLIGWTALSISFRSNRVRRQMIQQGETPEARSTLVGLIQMFITLVGIAILASLIIGYVTLARFLSYELVWFGIVFGSFYILSQLVVDGCEALFSTHNRSGKRIQASLNIDERYLAQAASLLSGLGKTLLVIMAAMALLNGTFNSATPIELVQKLIGFWGGKGLESLDIVPAHVVNALICLIVGIYILRALRRWLESDFLPKTSLDIGMRVSLITLMSNIGYVLVILLTLSIMGLQWNKLAWIVSALSVGIGFGLQEIVKNFISGLILLTERPVKVGDLVSISGIEGDIRRINVRATEIQLSDKSTVIVPNSQLISQNVRNATMGNAQGVATITLTFPLDIDPTQVRQLLLDVYSENERILENPEPAVSFKDLTPSGITLSVTGNVSTPRLVSGAKSDLLFDILTRLRKEGIALSAPQTMVIERRNANTSMSDPAEGGQI
ncbi:Small-conductance mechanosensitive channel [Izhakiella capsodis]|uniref:Small-conductance mechanosensitive channel n=1 Tax=Izhakiella capsodis TaxID=1367852 RepID=A0A1I4UGU5_9GAMM|nr:DUF3772 domain-containing protein [Izhakiella capsodis]SFM88209.1 Small-conductance mechanosensitive channel [Izhakiella capsodis]